MKPQNTSHAVMSQRERGTSTDLDFFPTPPWATRALCECLLGLGQELVRMDCLEPACGKGDMAEPLKEYFGQVVASDIHDYGYGGIIDYLNTSISTRLYNWIITNPPFNLAEKFAHKAINGSSNGVALLVRTQFIESTGRYSRLFKGNPPSDVFQFTERVPIHKGKLTKTGTTATSYCWIVWRQECVGQRTNLHWIPPCRKRLERDEDYND